MALHAYSIMLYFHGLNNIQRKTDTVIDVAYKYTEDTFNSFLVVLQLMSVEMRK